MGINLLHGILLARCSAARGDHAILEGEHFKQGGVFQSAKRRFPVPLKQQGNRRVIFFFDIEIQINEIHVESLGQSLADSTFPSTGKPNKNDVFHYPYCLLPTLL